MKRILSQPLLPLLVLIAIAAFALPAARLLAQGQTETKIRLMADGLRARDAGDLETARAKFQELLDIAPNDASVQRLLAGVNASIAAAGPVQPVPAASGAASEPAVVDFRELQKAQAKGVVYGPAEAEADRIARAEEARIKGLIDEANARRKAADAMGDAGRYDEAIASLDAAAAALPRNALTAKTLAAIDDDKKSLLLDKSQSLLKAGDIAGARAALEAYATANPGSKKAGAMESKIERAEFDPPPPPIDKASPNFIRDQKEYALLAAKGRSQYLAGDLDGAQETFRQVETLVPDSPEAKSFLTRIAKEKAQVGELNREKTRQQMIEEVTKGWQRPGIYQERNRGQAEAEAGAKPLAQKLASIQIPSINFSNVELGRVVASLSAISEEFDPATGPARGVNIVLIDPSNKNPGVSITLRNMSLKRILDFITDSIGYQYEIQADAIVVRPGGETSTLDTEFFPITRSTVIRMTGSGPAPTSGGLAAASNDPFAPPPATAAPAAAGIGAAGEAQALRGFLQQAGVNFDNVAGSSLAYDGSAMIVTNTTRNIERIRNILNRYNDVRQVEIEAKFMEVQEGALDELGVNWNVTHGLNGDPNYLATATTGLRGLSDAFAAPTSTATGSIVRPETTVATLNSAGEVTAVSNIASLNKDIVNTPPSIPGTVDVGQGAGALAVITGVLGEFNVDATLRALSRKTGTDLLSAPKVTVLSGNPANIVVGQELRYPQSYGEIQSEVGNGSSSSLSGGAAGVTITAGTPQDFTMRNVGVELAVTPTVEEDDYSISLDLHPKVTEFEGFIEYGGQSVAISGSTTVTVPSGFFQPVFSTREISTKVTIWDGATLVMGGLTREEVKKVNDKVPILGDIPLIGRAFKSKGETSQKRNLLVFVTANLVSPGGSPKKQTLKGVQPSSLFQNPTIVTPGSSESRVRTEK